MSLLACNSSRISLPSSLTTRMTSSSSSTLRSPAPPTPPTPIASSSSSSSSTSTSLPILDIQDYYNDRSQFVTDLRCAAHHIGFFLLEHDVPREIVQRQLRETRTFFGASSRREKESISYEHSPAFRGYMSLGTENTNGVVDYREQIEYATEYPTPSSKKNPNSNNNQNNQNNDDDGKILPYYRRLKSSTNPWPTTFQPDLEPTTRIYVHHVCRIADCIRKSLCLALGQDENILDHIFGTTTTTTNNSDEDNKVGNDSKEGGNRSEDHEEEEDVIPHWVLKLINYPVIQQLASSPFSSSSKEEQAQDKEQQSSSAGSFYGVGEHTDTNFLTLVLQESNGNNSNNNNNSNSSNSHDGLLQVYSIRDQGWITIPNDLGSGNSNLLICNLGEQAEIISNGYFLATPHRVLPNIHGTKNRISVPLFYNPTLQAIVKPIINDDANNDDNSNTIKWERDEKIPYWQRKSCNTMLSCVGENTFKSLARSHLHIFNKYHDDLILQNDGSIIVKGDGKIKKQNKEQEH